MHSTCLPAPFVMMVYLLVGADNCSSTIFRASKNVIDLLYLTESISFYFFHVGQLREKTGCGPLQLAHLDGSLQLRSSLRCFSPPQFPHTGFFIQLSSW